MKQLSCPEADFTLSEAEVEAYILAATFGHLCPTSLNRLPVDVLERFTALSATRVQTVPTAAAISIYQSEAKRP